jgi:hypothetical protein
VERFLAGVMQDVHLPETQEDFARRGLHDSAGITMADIGDRLLRARDAVNRFPSHGLKVNLF